MPRIDIDLIEEEWDADVRPPSRSKLSTAAQDRIARDEPGQVLVVDRGRVTVRYGHGIADASYAGSMRGEKVVVGDHVRVRPPRHESDVARITERLDRRTVLLRTKDDAVDEERVVVANADQVVIVLGADYLQGGVGFLDRVLVAASAGGLGALVCINKIDLADGDLGAAVAAVGDRYRAIGYDVLLTSAATGQGIDALRDRLLGTWTAMSGHSGVGKSSLFNRLVPEATQQVRAVGPRGGRHTTVAALALPIPDAPDTWLVDTPGVRSFGLGNVTPTDLDDHFPELAELRCALDDCQHDGEPGCRLAEAAIHPQRLESYRRFLTALRGGEDP